jgi:DNA helicase-2/ATP-dependent DNA helicase PcrA
MVNKPSRGVGPATADRIVENAQTAGEDSGNLTAAAQRLMPGFASKAQAGLTIFLKAIKAGRSVLEGGKESKTSLGKKTEKEKPPRGRAKQDGLSAGEGLSVCVVRLAEDSGMAEYHLTHDEITGNQRIGNLQELANAASLYPSTEAGLLEFLEHIELDRSIEDVQARNGEDGAADTVTLITLHNTKGLEFRRVIMTGVEQGVFPREDKKGEELEEERRLFYVGATRAMDELYLSSCAMRRMFGRTMPMEASLFLREIDKDSLRIIGSPPYGFTRSGGAGSYVGGRSSPKRDIGKNAFSPGGQVSSDGRWQLGARLFHDDHGYGAVVEIRESGEGPVIRVRFETGHELRFLSLHQSSRFTKIAYDD